MESAKTVNELNFMDTQIPVGQRASSPPVEVSSPLPDNGKAVNSRTPACRAETENPAPDGGRQAWMQVIGGFFVWMNTLGIANSYGEFQSFYQVDLLRDRAPTSIAWIGSTHAATMFACGIFAGPLIDKGYFYHCQTIGSIFIVLGYMMTSLCIELWQFVLAQGLCMGLDQVWSSYLCLVSSRNGSAPREALLMASLQVVLESLGVPALLRVRFKPIRTRALIDRSMKKDYAFLMLTLSIITVWAACYVPWNYLSAFAIESRITDLNFGFYTIAIMNASSVFGRLILSAIADERVGIVNMSIILVFLTGMLCFAWMGVNSRAGLIVFAIVIGFIGGGLLTLIALIPLRPPQVVNSAQCLPSLCTVTDPDYIGTRLGMCMLLGGLCLLWGSLVAGALIDQERSYTHLEAYAGGLLVSTAFLLALTRMIRTGPAIMVKF
ncbi:MFS general substrate transporter [Setomelanomma holmii]|uniref:MFS general substrate transporter n=1 Tax=Setomelanomma holmii TaxID=210430 RepID=A0A9P4HN06_9PLEO|nr:MFS general substrate transporter [Setomelanomma holmii]